MKKKQTSAHHRRTVQRGDVYELNVAGGFAYVQVTHRHRVPPVYGWYLRVLPGIYGQPPSDLNTVVNNREVFGAFCPLVGELKFVGKVEIPDFAQHMPWFKHNPLSNPPARAVWGLWKGCETGHDLRLSKGLPVWAVDAPLIQLIDNTILRERIESGWTPAQMVKPHHLTETTPPDGVAALPTWTDFWEFNKTNRDDDFWWPMQEDGAPGHNIQLLRD